jgi:hypothetical protein
MCWYEFDQGDRRCVPGRQCRVLVAQDDGYIEMAYWNGTEFEFDRLGDTVPRVRYWCDLPDTPTEDGEAPF